MWVGTWTFQSGMGGPPSDLFRTAVPFERPDRGAQAARPCAHGGAQAQSAKWVLDSMHGYFHGPCGGLRPAGGGNRVEVRVDTAFWSSRVTFPRRGVAVRHSSSVTRPAPLRTAIVGLLAAFVSFALLPCGVAAADTVTTDFESFQACSPPQPVFVATCTVDGQDGWKSALPGQIGPSLPIGYDQQVVGNHLPGAPAPAAFGAKSLRISNAYGTAPDTSPPEYEHQTYSKPTKAPAGQDLTNTEYTAQFSFISIHPDQNSLGSISPSAPTMAMADGCPTSAWPIRRTGIADHLL